MGQLDADVLEVAEAHVRICVQKLGLLVMSAEARADLAECGRLGAALIAKLKTLPAPDGAFEELAPHGMQLFMLLKAYESAPSCIAEAVKRHVPELAPLVEGLLAD